MIGALWNQLWSAITSATFSDWGDVIEVFTFIIGGAIYFEVSRIRRELMRRGRIGPLREELNVHAREIQALLRDVTGSQNEIRVRLAQSAITLRFVVKIVDRPHRTRFQALAKQMEKGREQMLGEAQLWRMYGDIMALVETLKQIEEEIKWQA